MSEIRNIIFNAIPNTHGYEFKDLAGIPSDRIKAERLLLEGYLIERMAASDAIIVLAPEMETEDTLEYAYINSTFMEETAYIQYDASLSKIPVLVLARYTVAAKNFAKIFWDEDIKKLNPKYDPSRILAIGFDIVKPDHLARMVHDLSKFYNEKTEPLLDKL